ncbi:MAG: nicotinate phosphoribosyltransferase [Candidatus Altimarinota bacterium]
MNTQYPYTFSNSFAHARDEAEVDNLLNTDIYKFLMLDFILSKEEYRNMRVRWKMTIRNKDVRIADIIPETALRSQFDATKNIRGVSQAGLSYLRGMQVGNRPMLRNETLGYLSDFSLPEYSLENDGHGGYTLEFEGAWPDSTLWEIYALKIVNSLYLYYYAKKAKLSPSEWNGVMTRMYGRLYDNVASVRSDPRITFSEFGTRRAASTDIHRQVNAILSSDLPGQYLGTSNVMISMEMGNANPKGTNAHELRMIPTAFEDEGGAIVDKMYAIDREWQAHFPELGILLPDTYGSSFYFANCPEDIAMNHTGCRVDSKDPLLALPEYQEFLRKWDIDPKTKLALPSDGLTYDVIKGVTDRFHGIFGVLTNGWGTELSNNTKGTLPKEKEKFGPFGSMSIVVKPDAVWRPDKNAWVSCVKLSDNPNKAMGSKERVKLFKETFGVEGMESQEVRV